MNSSRTALTIPSSFVGNNRAVRTACRAALRKLRKGASTEDVFCPFVPVSEITREGGLVAVRDRRGGWPPNYARMFTLAENFDGDRDEARRVLLQCLREPWGSLTLCATSNALLYRESPAFSWHTIDAFRRFIPVYERAGTVFIPGVLTDVSDVWKMAKGLWPAFNELGVDVREFQGRSGFDQYGFPQNLAAFDELVALVQKPKGV